MRITSGSALKLHSLQRPAGGDSWSDNVYDKMTTLLIRSLFILASTSFPSNSHCVLFCPPAAGHEGVRGHGLGRPPHSEAEEGHLAARAEHRRHHQTVQQVCEAGVRAVHRTHGAVGRHRGAQRWTHASYQDVRTTAPHETASLSPCPVCRWRELCGAGSDCSARSQPAGEGKESCWDSASGFISI